jgi:hypothetical protein
MKNKANYILSYLIVFLITELVILYLIKDINFGSYWVSFSIGVSIILLALIYTVKNKEKDISPKIPVLMNSIGVSFLANAYLIKFESSISPIYMLVIFLVCITFYILFTLSLYFEPLLKISGWWLFILGLIALIPLIFLWVTTDKVLFSNLTLLYIITISMCFCSITSEVHKSDIDSTITIFSFSSIIVLLIVLSLLLESGDYLEGLGSFGGSSTNKRQTPYNIKI